MKYIIIDDGYCPITPVVFPDFCDHAGMARLIAKPEKVIGAGFCSFGSEGVSVWGKSTSLNMEAKKEDVFWLEKMRES